MVRSPIYPALRDSSAISVATCRKGCHFERIRPGIVWTAPSYCATCNAADTLDRSVQPHQRGRLFSSFEESVYVQRGCDSAYGLALTNRELAFGLSGRCVYDCVAF
jgi:hypothetical protein